MFTDPVFRTALFLSLLAHVSIIAPHPFLFPKSSVKKPEAAEFNYIVISEAQLSKEEEILKEEEAPEIELEGTAYLAEIQLEKEEDPEAREKKAPEEEQREVSSETKKQEAYLDYYNLIRERIRKEVYSTRRSLGVGSATFEFTLSSSGMLRKIRCVTGGTSPVLERKVLKGISTVQPFPPFPEELGKDPINFSLTVTASAS